MRFLESLSSTARSMRLNHLNFNTYHIYRGSGVYGVTQIATGLLRKANEEGTRQQGTNVLYSVGCGYPTTPEMNKGPNRPPYLLHLMKHKSYNGVRRRSRSNEAPVGGTVSQERRASSFTRQEHATATSLIIMEYMSQRSGHGKMRLMDDREDTKEH